MVDTIIDGVTNISLSKSGRAVVTHADVLVPPPDTVPPLPSGTRFVSTLSDLRSVLADDVQDVTIVGAITTKGEITVSRIPRRTIRAQAGAILQGDGGDFRILALTPGRGGMIAIYGLTIDGGWRSNPGECQTDAAANFYLPNLDSLELNGCITMFSRRTGIFATNTGQLILRNCTGYAMPRDFIWSNGSLDVLIEGCRVSHCGDDGIGCHVQPGTTGENRTIVIRNNELRDTLGIKVLGGGKSITIGPGNKLYGCGFYGIRLGVDPTTGEGAGTQRNILVNGNTIENVRATSPCHTGQTQGVWLFMYAPDENVANVVIGSNTLIRTDDNQNLFKDVYPWAGLGAYSKTQFLPDASIDIGNEATRYVCKNPTFITGVNTKVGFDK